jgi:CheY-like chemotaxis protein
VKTILVVDDEFGIALMLASTLEDEGYRVFTAANGRQGLERLAENRPDLIISDLMMPVMDGAAMSLALRENPDFRHIPIVMMSGLPEATVRERFDGYAAYMRKPFFEPVLLKTVAEVLAV